LENNGFFGEFFKLSVVDISFLIPLDESHQHSSDNRIEYEFPVVK